MAKKVDIWDPEEPRFPQLAKEALILSSKRPNPVARVWAKIMDFALANILGALLFLISPWLRGLFIVLFWAGAERFGRGQSPGKWLLGLHLIETRRGNKASFYSNFIRNLPFIVLSLVAFESSLIGVVASGLALLWLLMDLYFIFYINSGLRVGDVMAQTRVWEYKDDHTKFLEQFLKEDPAS